MTDTWIIQDIEKQIAHRNLVVMIDPLGQCSFLLPHIQKKKYTILKTDDAYTEEWQKVKEELFIRYEAETKHKQDKLIIYTTRPQSELTFLFDYCFTHGCIDLSNPGEWLRKKLFTSTGLQVSMDSPMLLSAAKLGLGKDLSWWKKILQNLEDLVSMDDEFLPFVSDPDGYLKKLQPDVKRLFEEKLFEMLGQPYRNIPAQTLATEMVNNIFSSLYHNRMGAELLTVYHKWLDSNAYADTLSSYIAKYKADANMDIWAVHRDHCFEKVDLAQLDHIVRHLRDKAEVREKLHIVKQRIKSRKAVRFVPSWWEDVVTIIEFDSTPLASCNTLAKVSLFYTSQFHKLDRAIRNIYAMFIQNENIVRPLQEHYESLNHELLQHWFDHRSQYASDQQGYLPQLLSTAKPGIAIIVGDGVRYEIAAYVISKLKDKCEISTSIMYADLPSETEHNMSALYVGNKEVLPVHKDREKKLLEITKKDITYLNLEALHYGVKADYLILTYKDIDNVGEKLQLGAIKLFSEFENILTDKIQLLLSMGYREVHLVTDHGFVLTGLLDESDKIDANVTGKKDVHERFIRTVQKQNNADWLEFDMNYGEYKYMYMSKSHRPFKTRGTYGYSHGGCTPQELIIPNFIFSKSKEATDQLPVTIINKAELGNVPSDLFILKIQGKKGHNDLFGSQRKIQVKLYVGNIEYLSSDIFTIESESVISKEFSMNGNTEVKTVILDAISQEQLDTTIIKKSNDRDFGGLM